MSAGASLLESVAAGLLEHGGELLGGQASDPHVLAEIARHACALWERARFCLG